jgi:hypothetical protein
MDERKILSKDEILGVEDLPREEVYVPEWKGSVIIRGFTAAERDEFEANIFTGEGKGRKFNHSNLRARLLSLTICNEVGGRIFSDIDIEKLGKKSAKVMDKLFGISQKLSGIGQTDLDDLLKNLKPDQPV